jgi:alpha-glucosidase (family GH31 glycosyl hydrolase)
MNRIRTVRISLVVAVLFTALHSANAQQQKILATKADTLQILSATKTNATTVVMQLSTHQQLFIDFYADNIFRLFLDPSGSPMCNPEATPPANLLIDQPRKSLSKLQVTSNPNDITISTEKTTVVFDKPSGKAKVFDSNKKLVIEMLAPPHLDKDQVLLQLNEAPQEYFYGGGVQNGRFSHKGKTIAIENQNSWTDGGVASPTPFFWSTNGYGLVWHTFKKGKYDFGATQKGMVRLSHETGYLDVFFMIDNDPAALLNDFYQLTGNPVLIPKFGFYEGHLNAYNRDFWKQDSTGILFENGNRYKESQKDNGGAKESLNGEKNNYPFSARAVIDRYKAHDMPLGWILPNDGYGAGYGQTTTLDSNIQNLKAFGNYAREQGVQIGLWTQSDLHPIDTISALLQRDIVKEVGVAGVRVLKTDVAWVGRGYSFGLNGVADAANIMTKDGNNARPFIISLDGWAGTQRYATVWSGDQTGGQWEYIRFHIPTYLGSGLSGQPNITSDMDGIFGGKNAVVNTRDFQWKTFTPMQLNMDGWGANEKYPHALGEPSTSINRMYLKLKSALLPYSYSIAKEAVSGLPMIRALFLEYPNSYTLGKSTQYEFLYGPSFLIAPVYKATRIDAKGNDIRNGIYLPEGTWIDYFSGDSYQGGRIINNFDAPLWKLPVFVKAGSIIPMTEPNNNVSEINKEYRIYEVYPAGNSSFTEYDDDGLTEAYKKGIGTTTLIQAAVTDNIATITVHPTVGHFNGFAKNKVTEIRINVAERPSAVKAMVGNRIVKLAKATSKEQFERATNVYFYDAAPDLNKFATSNSEFQKVAITKNPQLLVKIAATDITKNAVKLTVSGYRFSPSNQWLRSAGRLSAPLNANVPDTNATAYTLMPIWNKVPHADFYEILFAGQLYSTIKDTSLLFEDLVPDSTYSFEVRAVNKSGLSAWNKFSAKTKMNPLEFTIKNIGAQSSVEAQEGGELSNLFDGDEISMWHTCWNKKAVPFYLTLDLMSVNQLDKIQYLPRNRGNGILLKGSVSFSVDKTNWSSAGGFEWARNGDIKEFAFPNRPTARYLKIFVTEAVGDFGSGRELYVFKVPGSESFIPGDINNDQRIDENDLTSYINYTGLRKGDGDFDGYVSKGDVNRNGVIDAYDISTVATRLHGGVVRSEKDNIGGRIQISSDKRAYKKDETIQVLVKGINMKAVNAFSFALPYNPQEYDFVGFTSLNVKNMDNFSNDRLHTNGRKALYVTFVNLGEQETLQGNADLFLIKLKAKKNLTFNLKTVEGVLVDKQLNVIQF